MVKKPTFLIILLLLCFTVGYSQTRRPKSAKKPTIQDVIEEKKTPEDILREIYKARFDSASQLSYSCIQMLVETKIELDSVRKANQTLYVIIDRQLDTLESARNKEKRAIKVMLKEHYRNRSWVKAFIGQTVFVIGGVGAFITGAWVPIGMGVLAVEIFLVMESKYSEVKLEDKNLTKKIGIDIGLNSLISTSTGELYGQSVKKKFIKLNDKIKQITSQKSI